jgi:hypothetical protein
MTPGICSYPRCRAQRWISQGHPGLCKIHTWSWAMAMREAVLNNRDIPAIGDWLANKEQK